MSFFKDWMKTKYKIVPVYNPKSEICGYTVLFHNIISWLPVKMYLHVEDDFILTDNVFATYDEAMTFLKHETTIITDEEIHNRANG